MAAQPFERFPAVYPITDPKISGLSHFEQYQQLAKGGAKLIQLRDKTAASDEFFRSVVEVCRAANEQGILVIVNDRVDIAIAAGAPGVHLGQDDLPPEQARRLLGEAAVIGYSTHSEEQAKAAASLPVDYIAIGPVFGTSTKENPDQAVGLEGVSAAKEAVGTIPLVAIGGIDEGNFRSVLEAGADSVAVISGILKDPSGIESAMRRFLV
ncbi:MAG: thiamine phosphate synthase [Acidobacteriota bacterium]|nr:MAG: thiamine phosphate synthase [Acidobacteriota bacterium]